jgi:hypothetical protein
MFIEPRHNNTPSVSTLRQLIQVLSENTVKYLSVGNIFLFDSNEVVRLTNAFKCNTSLEALDWGIEYEINSDGDDEEITHLSLGLMAQQSPYYEKP